MRLGSAPAWVDADPTPVEHIIANLLNNAFKYTSPGGLTNVTAGVDRDESVLEVFDSGVGISPKLLPHVFDVFVQGESSLDRARGGMGISLALVHQLVSLHDGSIAAYIEGATAAAASCRACRKRPNKLQRWSASRERMRLRPTAAH